MSSRTLPLDDALHGYLLAHGVRETPAAVALREHTAARSDARMQISPEQGALMAVLVRAMGARRIVEVGTFTGYSALCMAQADPEVHVTACDISEETAAVARQAWNQAGVGDRIDLRLAPAAKTLQALLDEGAAQRIDMMFIDADKTGYATYVELGHALLRRGGLLCIDNVLWSGAVLDPQDTSPNTVALRDLNTALATDDRWDISMVPIGDGLTLLCKR